MTKKLPYPGNAPISEIEDLYKDYLNNPDSVEDSWRYFFEGFELARTTYHESEQSDLIFADEFKVINLINAYRMRGHLFTRTNPVRKRRQYFPTLDITNFGLNESDLEKSFKAGNELGIGQTSLKNIVQYLEDTYCRSIGVEFMYIRNPKKVEWLKNKIEQNRNTPHFAPHVRRQILQKLVQAVGFEQFLHKRYTGQKRFSLEGCEALIPALDFVIEKGAELGIKEFVIGMPHRGRLNVLANIFNKSYQQIFSEFEGKGYDDNFSLGDVKYHLGYSAEMVSRKGEIIKLHLSPNPSHLEAVNPVVEGITRAKIDHEHHDNYSSICPVLIHGDAAIAGQGIVYEVVQMEKLLGYRTGGTIHIVVNNQLGFTTDYIDARSSTYCTDVAKTTLSPVFHVNADDPEAVVHVIQLAVEYRLTFHNDVFIDILGYRRYGHNESDEPRFTQPTLYKIIARHPDVRKIYADQLISEDIVSQADADRMVTTFENMLQDNLLEARKKGLSHIEAIFSRNWLSIRTANEADFEDSPETGVPAGILKDLNRKINILPEGIAFFDKIVRLVRQRYETIENEGNIDWALAEQLAFASLLFEKTPVRLCGQDVERGTFSQRHAVLNIEDTNEKYIPLNNLGEEYPKFRIFNSLLSEYGALGFEYGYAMVSPDYLTIWEAQFGDFSNGAQIIIDQYISSAEDKWKIMNGLVMLLPHGYEGQGPEHSSARIERFLVLCGNLNMQVCYPSTPANYFHLLRRQIKRDFRKPLVVFTPKSLLRHPACVSSLNELAQGKFHEVYDDSSVNPENAKKVVICSGKIYYELMEERLKRNEEKTAIIRLEQYYPLPNHQLNQLKNKYFKAKKWLWVQEEPINMGAWPFLNRKLKGYFDHVVARFESGSPAGGLNINHVLRQNAIINETFNI